MKILKLSYIIIFCFLLGHYVHAGKELVKKDFDVKNFSEIEVSGFFDVTLIKSDKCKIEVEALDEIYDYLKIDVKNKKLNISTNNKKTSFDKKTSLTIYFKDFSKLTTNGLMNLRTKESISADKVYIETNGVIKAHLELVTNDLGIEINGTGKMQLFGNAKNADFAINGAGKINAYNMATNNCNVEISGAGLARVFSLDELNVDLSGISKVFYKGNPKNKDFNCSFLSKVKKAEKD